MSGYRPRGGAGHQAQSYRTYPPQQRDDFYDDCGSTSRSPDRRGRSSPDPRQSSPHDFSMTGLPPAVPPSAPQAAAQEGFRIRGRSARSPDRRHEHQQYDRYHDRSSDRDRDRERYYNNDGRGDGDRGRGRGAPSQGHGYGYDGTRSPSPAQGRSPRRPRSYYDNNRDDGARSRSPPPIRRSRAYYDRDDPRSTRYRDDSRSRSRGRGTLPGERPTSRGKPSKEIMMEGLASHLTEDDVRSPLPTRSAL